MPEEKIRTGKKKRPKRTPPYPSDVCINAHYTSRYTFSSRNFLTLLTFVYFSLWSNLNDILKCLMLFVKSAIMCQWSFSVDPSSPDSNGFSGQTMASLNSNVSSGAVQVPHPSNITNNSGSSVSMLGGRRDFCVDRFLQNKGMFSFQKKSLTILEKVVHCPFLISLFLSCLFIKS